MAASRFKLVFFCPPKNTTEVLDHLFKAYPLHVGVRWEFIKRDDRPRFDHIYPGQFRGIGSASPAIGEAGRLEKVEENRVEVLVRDEGTSEQIRGAVSELKKAHPYEEVAYEVYRIEDF